MSVALVASLVYLGTEFFRLDRGGVDGWDTLLALDQVERIAFRQHRQLPHWNPFACGGTPTLAHPLSRALSPFRLLQAFLPPLRSLQIETWLLLTCACVSSYLLLRARLRHRFSSVVGALVFAFSGAMAARAYSGHLHLLTVAWLPMVLWGARDARNPWTGIGVGGLGVALMLLGGGVQVALFAIVLVVVEATFVQIHEGRARGFGRAAGVFVLGVLLAAPRCLPALGNMVRAPSASDGAEQFAPGGPLWALVHSNYGLEDVGGARSWYEYAGYVGWLPVVMLLVAVWIHRNQARSQLVALAVLLLLAWGDTFTGAPWNLLHRLPFFEEIRTPSRFVLIAMWPLAELVALGIEAFPLRWHRWFGAAVALAMFFDLTHAARWPLTHTFVVKQPVLTQARSFAQIHGMPALRASAVRAGWGMLDCEDALLVGRLKSNELRGRRDLDYRGENYVLGPGEARLVSWSPEVIEFEVHGARLGSRLVINQNFDPAWHASGSRVAEWRGLLSVELAEGAQRVRLEFGRGRFHLGLVVSAFTLLGFGAVQLAHRRRRGKRPLG